MYRCIKKATITMITKGRNEGKTALQQKIIEEFDDMGMHDIKEFLKTRALCVGGYSESTDQKSGEKTLYIETEKFGKATYSNSLGKELKGKIRWNHLILDGQEVF